MEEKIKVTPEDIEEAIVREYYFTAEQGVQGARSTRPDLDVDENNSSNLALTTFCILILKNGYVCTGKSVCVDPKTFVKETGEIYAKKDALNEVYAALGYMLKEKLYLKKQEEAAKLEA